MIRKIDFSRKGDCKKVMDFIMHLDRPLSEEHERLAVDVINTLRLNTPVGPDVLDLVRVGVALTSMYD